MKTIDLTKGRFTLVDDADYEYLSKFNWSAIEKQGKWYAVRSRSRKERTGGIDHGRHILMHRELLKPSAHLEIDHMNGNSLDNQRENLRICTHLQNQANVHRKRVDNKSGATGVFWVAKLKQYRVYVNRNYKRINIGCYKTLEEAKEEREKYIAKELKKV